MALDWIPKSAGRYNIDGIDIHVVADQPKMTLSLDVPVTDEFRTEMNAWMLEFFGTTNLIADGQVLQLGRQAVFYTNPRTLRRLIVERESAMMGQARRSAVIHDFFPFLE